MTESLKILEKQLFIIKDIWKLKQVIKQYLLGNYVRSNGFPAIN